MISLMMLDVIHVAVHQPCGYTPMSNNLHAIAFHFVSHWLHILALTGCQPMILLCSNSAPSLLITIVSYSLLQWHQLTPNQKKMQRKRWISLAFSLVPKDLVPGWGLHMLFGMMWRERVLPKTRAMLWLFHLLLHLQGMLLGPVKELDLGLGAARRTKDLKLLKSLRSRLGHSNQCYAKSFWNMLLNSVCGTLVASYAYLRSTALTLFFALGVKIMVCCGSALCTPWELHCTCHVLWPSDNHSICTWAGCFRIAAKVFINIDWYNKLRGIAIDKSIVAFSSLGPSCWWCKLIFSCQAQSRLLTA